MFKKNLILFLLIFSFSAMATIKEDLAVMYAIAFKNNWKKVSAKSEAIIEDYDRHRDATKTLQHLESLEEFVLSNDLNEQKMDNFLKGMDNARNSLNKSLQKSPVTKHHKLIVPNSAEIPVINNGITSWKKTASILGMFFFIAGIIAFLMTKRTKKAIVHKFAFESILDPNGAVYWRALRPSLVGIKEIIVGPTIISFDNLFSMEFPLIAVPPRDSLIEIKKRVETLKGELLIVSEWQADHKISQKLVLNFTSPSN